jgi:hypothetical protein
MPFMGFTPQWIYKFNFFSIEIIASREEER